MTENTQTTYVLLNLEIGEEAKALKNIRKVKDVKNAYKTYGVYDCVACVEAANIDKLRETVDWRVRRADGVRSVLNMIMVRDKDGPIGFEKDPKTGKITYCHPSLK